MNPSLEKNNRGFTLVEVVVAIAVFLLFAVGIYGSLQIVFKVVYQSRIKILETAVLSEELEVARNLPFGSVGIVGGVPAGVLTHAKTVIRNGVSFNLITTVRNIDDPFDGTLGGNPNDTSPADYKLVEISALCQNCNQTEPVILSTQISPKGLEGASQNGALFINVFDAAGLPVADASVHIVNSAVTPNLSIDDLTDNDGMLRVVDAPTGTQSFHITVTKAGYSTDGTVNSSPDNPNPAKPPANVVSQSVTDISFAIDRVGSLNVHTGNSACGAVGGVAFSINGIKLIGTGPNIYKYSHNFSTDGSGNKNLTDLEWDSYHLDTSGLDYDLAGSAPMLPLKLTPGLNQELSLILRAHSANSLLVKVKDAGTGLPLSNSTVRLTGTGYDESITTGLGYRRQTDWSGGSGQAEYLDERRYFSDNGGLEASSPAGDLKLKKAGGNFLASGWLESSTFDLGSGVNFNNIIWEPLINPTECGTNPVVFQLSASDIPSPASWNFTGPDGTVDSFYTSTSTVIYSGLNGNRYLRYRVYLITADTKFTPTLSEVAFTLTNSCTPPGQSFFESLVAGAYTLEVSRDGYTTNSGTVDVSGNSETTVNLSHSE